MLLQRLGYGHAYLIENLSSLIMLHASRDPVFQECATGRFTVPESLIDYVEGGALPARGRTWRVALFVMLRRLG